MNVTKLDATLKAAGIPIHGVDSNGSISFKPEATSQQIADAATIVANHTDDTPIKDWALDHVPFIRLFARLVYEYDQAVLAFVPGTTNITTHLTNTCQTLLNLVENLGSTPIKNFFRKDRNLLLGISAVDPLSPGGLSDADKRRLLQRYYEIANKALNVAVAAQDTWD
jgi:hypothetical protein